MLWKISTWLIESIKIKSPNYPQTGKPIINAKTENAKPKILIIALTFEESSLKQVTFCYLFEIYAKIQFSYLNFPAKQSFNIYFWAYASQL